LLVEVPDEPEVPEEPVPPEEVPPPDEVPPAEVPPEEDPPVAAPVPAEPVPAPVEPVEPVAAPLPVEPLLVAPEDVEGAVVAGEVVLAGEVSLGEVDEALLSLEDDEDDLADPEPSDTFSGAMMSGVVLGTVSCDTLLPPQALSPPVARSINPRAAARRAIIEKAWIRLRTAPSGAPSGGRRSGSR
jgi:hypothetical protein